MIGDKDQWFQIPVHGKMKLFKTSHKDTIIRQAMKGGNDILEWMGSEHGSWFDGFGKSVGKMKPFEIIDGFLNWTRLSNKQKEWTISGKDTKGGDFVPYYDRPAVGKRLEKILKSFDEFF